MYSDGRYHRDVSVCCYRHIEIQGYSSCKQFSAKSSVGIKILRKTKIFKGKLASYGASHIHVI